MWFWVMSKNQNFYYIFYGDKNGSVLFFSDKFDSILLHSCMCKVIEGEVSMPKCDIISEEEVKEGLVLSCMARPISGKIKINYDDV